MNSGIDRADWADQDDADVRERLNRIQSVASRLIERLDDTHEPHR